MKPFSQIKSTFFKWKIEKNLNSIVKDAIQKQKIEVREDKKRSKLSKIYEKKIFNIPESKKEDDLIKHYFKLFLIFNRQPILNELASPMYSKSSWSNKLKDVVFLIRLSQFFEKKSKEYKYKNFRIILSDESVLRENEAKRIQEDEKIKQNYSYSVEYDDTIGSNEMNMNDNMKIDETSEDIQYYNIFLDNMNKKPHKTLMILSNTLNESGKEFRNGVYFKYFYEITEQINRLAGRIN